MEQTTLTDDERTILESKVKAWQTLANRLREENKLLVLKVDRLERGIKE